MGISILVGSLILIDQIVKIIMLALNPQMLNNTGWGFSLEQAIKTQDNIIYIATTLIAIILIIKYITLKNTYIKTETKVILSFALAGAISNLIDRIWKGYVINYLQIPHFSAINVAYIYIIITWIGMAIILTKNTIKKGAKKNDTNTDSK